jgi:peptidyl-tRNA hydrolase, PTH2 family
MFLSQIVNGVGLVGIGMANLAAPVAFTQAVNAALRGVGLGSLSFPDDGSGAGHYGKLASFAIMYIGSLYAGLGWSGSKEFARYTIISRMFVYPAAAGVAIACGVPPSVLVTAFLDFPCALWCRSELLALGGGTAGGSDNDEDGARKKKKKNKMTAALLARQDMKMVLVVNTDLKMKKGKIAAQCCHAAVGVLEDIDEDDPDLLAWQRWGCAKVALKCGFEDMKRVSALAAADGLPSYIVCDAGRTQIPAGSETVCAIGPAEVGRIDKITGRGGAVPLKLL